MTALQLFNGYKRKAERYYHTIRLMDSALSLNTCIVLEVQSCDIVPGSAAHGIDVGFLSTDCFHSKNCNVQLKLEKHCLYGSAGVL